MERDPAGLYQDIKDSSRNIPEGKKKGEGDGIGLIPDYLTIWKQYQRGIDSSFEEWEDSV